MSPHLGSLGLLGAIALTVSTDSRSEGLPRIPVKVETTHSEPYREYGTYFGRIEGAQEARLTAPRGGRVHRIDVKSGDHVKAGQSLCAIDAKEARLALEQTKIAESIAKGEHRRLKAHKARGSASQLQVERARLALLNAQSQTLTAQRAEDGAACRSPIDGTVVGVHIRQHEELRPGAATMHIAQLTELRVLVAIPEADVTSLSPGREALISVAQGRRSISGSVHSIDALLNEQDKSFRAEVHATNDDAHFQSGLTARVRILKHDLRDALVVPAAAIVTRRGKQVALLVSDGVVEERPVVVFSSSAGRSVIESGLRVGEQLIVEGQHLAVPGAHVNVVGGSSE